MAKRRDRRTRITERIARRNGVRANQIPVTSETSRRTASIAGVTEVVTRSRGRRGVRARARQNRIADRRLNGTYRQPSGGTITNS